MLEWFTRSLRPPEAQYNGADDGASSIEEPTETPAPLFAVRAFKTAIFGTPHPHQREVERRLRPKGEDQRVKSNAPAEIPESDRAPKEGGESCSDLADVGGKPAPNIRLDPLASPAKGILLTPGTAATRRKTVSFGHMEAKDREKAEQRANNIAEAETNLAFTSSKLKQDAAPEGKPRHSTLTRTLIELSKQKPEKEHASVGTDTQEKNGEQAPSMGFCTESILGADTDVTVDLNQPRSRSGQHWKTEYDQYHRRSNREMRKIIKYGQNVKSYAVKKDSEAINLSEKLKKELAKVAVMEAKVSKLATRLSNAEFQGSNEESDQSRLVSELAQQTALAIKYKQRADGLRVALQKQGSSEAFEDPPVNLDTEAKSGAPSEVASIREELDCLRATANAAENQAIRLEKENAALKRSLARVKEEMMSYETRRQAREERLKKREAKHKAAREECEIRLAQLMVEHEEILRASGELPVVGMVAEIQSIQKEAGTQDSIESRISPEADLVPRDNRENAQPSRSDEQANIPYISPPKRRLQKPTVDIWTLSSPREDENQAPSSKEPTELPPSSVKHDIHRTLKEIDQNLVPKHEAQAHQPLQLKPTKPDTDNQMPASTLPPLNNNTIPSATRRMHNRRTTIGSPRPSMISLARSPEKISQPPQITKNGNTNPKPLVATTGRSASLMSRVGSRTNTMGSGRASSLSLERAEAAKARLARRSVEKRRKEGRQN